ncbi:MAG: HNH endonuclease [Lachnospiraceae bacterium]|nr:HNH endonuclease [Lachnospiraceae bacterium]
MFNDEYVWHHLDDYGVRTRMAAMQLVRFTVNDATKRHMGSAKQYAIDHNTTYKENGFN